MQYNKLGRTGIEVSRLCFGALTIGPLQANLTVREGAGIIRKALESGVNFIDTAELYCTYPYIREAIRGFEPVVIVSKCYAYTFQGARDSVEKALKELDRDYIDVFMLHEQESILTIRGHWEAIEYLLRAKEKGIVRAIGISTHHVGGVLGAATVPEIEVIHPLINMAGIGIRGGGRDDMLAAIGTAVKAGKGIYAMKALGGGNLISRAEDALNFVLSIPGVASVAVGMSALEEVEYNVRFFCRRPIPDNLKSSVERRPRRLHIDDWCLGCGNCVKKCRSGALSIIGGKAVVDRSLCVLCGYCAAACPEFSIKVI